MGEPARSIPFLHVVPTEEASSPRDRAGGARDEDLVNTEVKIPKKEGSLTHSPPPPPPIDDVARGPRRVPGARRGRARPLEQIAGRLLAGWLERTLGTTMPELFVGHFGVRPIVGALRRFEVVVFDDAQGRFIASPKLHSPGGFLRRCLEQERRKSVDSWENNWAHQVAQQRTREPAPVASPVNGLVESQASELWTRVLEEVRGGVTLSNFETWFRHLQPLRIDGHWLLIASPDADVTEWVTQRYGDRLDRLASKIAGRSLVVLLEEHPVSAAEVGS